jgi:hypothetical protein
MRGDDFVLSVKGIFDGEKAIPDSPVDLERGKRFRVIITFLEPIEDEENKNLSKFCGIWDDSRKTEEIINEIYIQRDNFKIREVKI